MNTDVREARWLEEAQLWEVTLQHLLHGVGDLSEHDRVQRIKDHGLGAVYMSEEKVRTRVLVSAVGGLVEPKSWPESITGKSNFQGEIFHSARWRHDVDLKGKNIIVVGTGCSAAQFVPELAKTYGAKSVTQVMRSPPWVVPRVEPPLGLERWERFGPWLNANVPLFSKSLRLLIAAASEFDWRLFGNSKYAENERRKYEEVLLSHMRKTVPSKYHDILTPDFPVGCKRRVLDHTWFPSLNDSRIELTTLPIRSVSKDAITLGPGRTYPPHGVESSAPNEEVTIPADVIILANGFETTKWLHPIKIIGRGGKSLQQVFDERGTSMYMGTAIDDFPNFFTIFGPNTVTGHTSVILTTESAVNLSLKLVKPILNGDVRTVEIKKKAQLDWTRDTQAALKRTVWHTGGCNSWYKDENGWNSTGYP